MGKSKKKARIANYLHHDRPKSKSSATTATAGSGSRKMKSFSRVSTPATMSRGGKGKKSGENGNVSSRVKLIAPNRDAMMLFQKEDRILLVGEGDFSFALCLATHHGCKNLLATSYDSEQTLYEKYPQAKLHIKMLRARVSETPSSPKGLKRKRDENESFGAESGNDYEEEVGEKDGNQDDQVGRNLRKDHPRHQNQGPKVLFSIDARKLGSGPAGGGKTIRNGFPRIAAPPSSGKTKRDHKSKDATTHHSLAHQKQKKQTGSHSSGGPWDIICFNFPHVGGISTDVNRQVRANQELLVSFFKACVPLLSEPVVPTPSQTNADENEHEYTDEEDWPNSGSSDDYGGREEKPLPPTTPGQILITLFEGEPYTLWNIRDLARHTGLRVVTSFRFPWTSYPGYSHARTVGEIEKRNGGKGRGGWRGEDREARMFVFEKKGAELKAAAAASGKKVGKGRRGESSDDDSG
ncbi:hypothetical protein PAAG_07376 [Paracoccidioides lutzii Pb01]|uniref:25S rRNA (uridine-N(3))-methyltransferase BMT5-like domain-containing protein n=1 Tax=Paracoccidioides lutzii (strain ATCC MYA-826 / Pb01) TaxID=502779 RepID=C1H9D5_PARBA|nr:hypothetical protein PAAG_07376 [Paracoccidioides lutzii Pb01]EEH36958.2 hypothetical protein PAAG_07376 [Paracoccidioides lutzii Pb01]